MNTAAMPRESTRRVSEHVVRLLTYCRQNDWAGFDPYDALNSRVFIHTPFTRSKVCRILITQILKRFPVNLRPFLLVPREHNAKAIALFVMALVKLEKLQLLDQEGLVNPMIERLIALRCPSTPFWCWGYSFPWQGRKVLVPKGAPNLVCTTFAANALLDTYETNQDVRCLNMAASAAEYILEELYWTEGDAVGFSYPVPGSRSQVHNANFLGGALLARIYKHTGAKQFLNTALRVARHSAARQHGDGSWDYGELAGDRWVDNFHTGYNLCALRSIGKDAGVSDLEPYIRRGFEFYRQNFFRPDGAPKYFHDRAYPIDSHSVAQSIITLVSLKDLSETTVTQAQSVFEWSVNHMWDAQSFFYYQSLRFFKNTIPYMRWSQAWMLLALTTLLEECAKEAQAGAAPQDVQLPS